VLPALVLLLEFLKQYLPDSSGHGLLDFLTNVMQSQGFPQTPIGPLSEAQVFAITVVPVIPTFRGSSFRPLRRLGLHTDRNSGLHTDRNRGF